MSSIPAGRRSRTLLLFLLLAGAATRAPAVEVADDPEGLHLDPPAAALPPPDSARVPLPVPESCRGYHVNDARWFDRAQGFFSQRACTPAVWFDRFFGEEREEDIATALVRVMPSVQYSENDLTDTGVRFKARVNLPNLRDRFSIVVNDDIDERAGLLPGETQRPQQANATGTESSAALRYLVKLADQSGADFDIGLRSQLKFFARARYHRGWVHSPVLQTRYTQSFYFRDGEGFGETSVLELERMLAPEMLVRWSTQATLSEEANGLELRDGIQLLRQLDRDRALSWNLAMTVKSDPAWQATTYVTSVRYRQRAFRPWFFVEVEPFLDAAREFRFHSNPGIAFRVEVWLGDSGERAALPAAAADVPTSPMSAGPTGGT